MNSINDKLLHYSLNLDYPNPILTLESQTNFLIQKQLNYFLNFFNPKDKILILEYQDDTISLIVYRLLKSITNIKNFQLFFYGRKFNTRSYVKKEKFITKRKLNKLINSNKVIYISVDNPIYQVIKNKKKFNYFPNITVHPIQNFTLEEIKAAQIFYHIGYIKNDIIETKETKLYTELEKGNIDSSLNLDSIEVVENSIVLINLTDSLEENEKVLNKVENLNGIFIYNFNKNFEEIKENKDLMNQLYTFGIYLKNKSNIIGYYNILNEQIKLKDLSNFTIINSNEVIDNES